MNRHYISNMFRHFKTICRHKYEVGKLCFKFGLYWQGIVHDLSKFTPTEFFTSVKYYQGNRSPIDAEKEEKGYSMVWAHHHNHNPHHWLYWIDFNRLNEITPMKMPFKYALEAIADWGGASKVYNNGEFNWRNVLNYYENNTKLNSRQNINKTTYIFWETILHDLIDYGEDFVGKLIKQRTL